MTERLVWIQISFFLYRVDGFRDAQRKFFNTAGKDPSGNRHPSVKCLVVEVTDENLGELLRLCVTINDLTHGGLQGMTLPTQIMNVRRIMQTLTEKQLQDMKAAEVSNSFITTWKASIEFSRQEKEAQAWSNLSSGRNCLNERK